ncbi:MAG: hypothetical protein N3A72_11160 [bacterium]|nr:hypothetical protein [bacterium]
MQCRNHIDREAVAMCISCQNFFCTECKTVIDGKNYCLPCAEKIQAASAISAPAESSPSTSEPPFATPPQTPVIPSPVSQSTAPTSAPTDKKKSGCLKWAIIGIILFLVFTALAIGALYFAWKYFVPKLKPAVEQQIAKSDSESSLGEDTTADETLEESTSGEGESATEPAEAEKPQPAESPDISQTEPSSAEPNSTPPASELPASQEPVNRPSGIIPPPKPVQPIEYTKLEPFLPKPISGWRISRTNSGNFEQENYLYTRAEREYLNPRERSKIIITISDYGRNPRMYRKFHRPSLYSNADGYLKLVPLPTFGYPAIEKMEYATRTAELAIEVDRRYVVEIKGENISDTTVLYGYANQIDLTNLAQLR